MQQALMGCCRYGWQLDGRWLPDLTIPLATHTGWNLRHQDVGNPDLVIGITAGWPLDTPVSATHADREATGDPRCPLQSVIRRGQDYVRQVRTAVQALVDRG